MLKILSPIQKIATRDDLQIHLLIKSSNKLHQLNK